MAKDWIAKTTGICDCCGKLKKVKLYGLQDGSTAWVCKECRTGK